MIHKIQIALFSIWIVFALNKTSIAQTTGPSTTTTTAKIAFLAPNTTRSPQDVIPTSKRMHDCQEVKSSGYNASGTYKIYPDGTTGIYVFCDMTTDGGGWTVIQSMRKRNSGRMEFLNRTPTSDYSNGFGSSCGDQWIGLDTLLLLTSGHDQEFRWEIQWPWVAGGNVHFARYRYFWIESAAMNYRISASELGTYYPNTNYAQNPIHNINGSIFISNINSFPKACAISSFIGPSWYNGCSNVWLWETGSYNGMFNQIEVKIRNPLAKWDTSRADTLKLIQKFKQIPRDCGEVQLAGNTENGVYPIYPTQISNATIFVYCDFTTDGGGWTAVHSRGSSVTQRENFALSWQEYTNGFGSTCTEGWIGLTYLSVLTSYKSQELKVSLVDWDGVTSVAKYDSIVIGTQNDSYSLSVGKYSGSAGDSLTMHNGAKFTTFDEDNDKWDGGNCAKEYGGGWWYVNCINSNLNGEYLSKSEVSNGRGIIWSSWKGYNYSIKSVDMKIRSLDFLSMKQMVALALS